MCAPQAKIAWMPQHEITWSTPYTPTCKQQCKHCGCKCRTTTTTNTKISNQPHTQSSNNPQPHSHGPKYDAAMSSNGEDRDAWFAPRLVVEAFLKSITNFNRIPETAQPRTNRTNRTQQAQAQAKLQGAMHLLVQSAYRTPLYACPAPAAAALTHSVIHPITSNFIHWGKHWA